MPDFQVLSSGPCLVAPFSHAVESDGRVILTGQVLADPDAADARLPAGVAVQTRRVLQNPTIVLEGVGFDLGHMVQCHNFSTEFERAYAVLNETSQGDLPTDSGLACKTVTVMARPLAEMNCIARHTQ